MGGNGSGRYSPRKTTSRYLKIDVRRWQREGLLKPDSSFVTQWSTRGKVTASIRVTASPRLVKLSYCHQAAGENENLSYPILLSWTSCNYGGKRPWFLCPAKGCNRRVAILYGGKIFACRHCNNLAYDCQRETDHDRELRRAKKIREQLGWQPGILSKTGTKPKRMHWETYYRLSNEHNDLLRKTIIWFEDYFDKYNL